MEDNHLQEPPRAQPPPSVFAQLKPIYLVVFVDTLGLAITIPVLPYYAVSLGVGGTELGLLMTAYAAAEVLGSFVMGEVSDRYGRKPTILVSFVGNTIGFVLCALSSSFMGLVAARVVGGLGGGSIPVAQAYIADVAPPEERSKWIGLTGAPSRAAAMWPPCWPSRAFSACPGLR